MGNRCSGRRYQGGKATTEDMLALDIRNFQRQGLLVAGNSLTTRWTRGQQEMGAISISVQADRVILDYRTQKSGSEWQSKRYPVLLDWSDTKLGGKRAWFLCPNENCGRRVAVLYGGALFACRKCHQLVYRSQREHISDRAARKADRIRDRLKWEPGILNPNGLKPKGMHWRTYHRLRHQHDQLVNQTFKGFAKRFALFEEFGD